MTVQGLLQVLIFGLVWGGVYALIAGGLNLIYGVLKVLNVAHGELVMISAYVAFWLFTVKGVSPILAILLAAPIAAALGVLLYELVARPLMASSGNVGALERTTLIAFFGVLLVLRDTAMFAFTPEYRTVRYLSDPVTIGPVSIAPAKLVVLAVAGIVTAGTFYLLHRTMLGKALRAISQDRDTARLMGVSVQAIYRWGFAIGSALAGIAGALLVMIYVINPSIGVTFTTKAFAISVLGRLGNQVGALVAAVTLGLAESFGSLIIGESYRDAIGYVLLVAVILWRFRGPSALKSGA